MEKEKDPVGSEPLSREADGDTVSYVFYREQRTQDRFAGRV